MEMLAKYTTRGSFNFYSMERRQDCFIECNEPSDSSGIYLIYGISGIRQVLVYIGISGRVKKGVFENRKGGIKGRLIEGKHRFDGKRKRTRYIFWKEMMQSNGFEKLRIDWVVTHNGKEFYDDPKEVEEPLTALYKPLWDRVNKY